MNASMIMSNLSSPLQLETLVSSARVGGQSAGESRLLLQQAGQVDREVVAALRPDKLQPNG